MTGWDRAPLVQMAQSNAPSHDLLVERLAPQPGETWLDIGTGAGGVAIRAARAGADVVGCDIATPAVMTAREAAVEAGVEARFERADVHSLPYGDGEFDVVSSAFGINFASDHDAAARELVRVTCGRIGLNVLPPDSRTGEIWTLLRRYASHGDHPADWGREERLHELLGGAFDLELERRESAPGPSFTPEETWSFFVDTFGPLQDILTGLDDGGATELREHFLEIRARYDGKPTSYVLVLGRRR